jgi:ribose 5-phosphate isomerase RpiB
MYQEDFEYINSKNSGMPESELHRILEKQKALQMHIIHEEKTTRKLFDIYLQWAESHKIEVFSSMPSAEDVEGDPSKGFTGMGIGIGMGTNADDDKSVNSALSHHHEDAHMKNETKKTLLLKFFDIGKRQVEAIDEAIKAKKEAKKLRLAKLQEERRLLKLKQQRAAVAGIKLTADELQREKELESEEAEEHDGSTVSSYSGAFDGLSHDEISALRSLEWVRELFSDGNIRQCLEAFPTLIAENISKDELTQFAVIIAEISNVMKRVKATLRKRKEAQLEEIALKDKRAKKKAERKLNRELKKEAGEDFNPPSDDEEDDHRLSEWQRGLKKEAKQRSERFKAGAQRRAQRVIAWRFAHPHLYVSLPGETPFCVLCKQAVYDIFKANYMEEESEWHEKFTDMLADKLDDAKAYYKELVKKEYQDKLIAVKREEERKVKYSKDILSVMNGMLDHIAEGVIYCSQYFTSKVDSYLAASDSFASKNSSDNFPHFPIVTSVKEKKIRIPKGCRIKLKNIPLAIFRTDLSIIDPTGADILSKNENDDPVDIPMDRPITPEEYGPPLSIMIR